MIALARVAGATRGVRQPSVTSVAVVAAVAISAAYLAWRPLSPDLAAQFARADLVRRAGHVAWWTGWYGGLSLPTYSVIVPSWTAALGVAATGAVALLVGTVAAGILVRDSVRPRLGTVAFAILGLADLAVGRVTFVVGVTIGMCALLAVRARRPVLGGVLAAATYLASPLAGLFLGLCLVAVLVADASRRAAAAWPAGTLLVAGAGMAALFPGTGVMPFRWTDAVPPVVCCVVVAIACAQRVIRTAAVVVVAAMAVLLVVPGAIGGNVARLPWLVAVPIVVAYGTVSRRLLAIAVVGLVSWPVRDVVAQVNWTHDASTTAAFFQPLVARLAAAQAEAGPTAIGARVELLDTINHSGAMQLVRTTALARGWDRQADNAQNPIFYRAGALTPASYHAWLHDLAVGWVAVPLTRLDYASRAEAALVAKGLPYLQLIWATPRWRLYRVKDPAPLATGATVTAVGPSSVTLRTDGPSVVRLQVRWSNYAQAVDAVTQQPIAACIENADGWMRISVASRQTFDVISPFDVTAPFRDRDVGCSTAPSAHAAGAELNADPRPDRAGGLGDGVLPSALAAAAHHQQVAVA